MNGDGLFSYKLDFSNKIKKLLRQYGDEKIRAIRIGRRPINTMVEKAFNIISLGKWNELRHKYNYDTLFHLFLIITLDDGRVLSFEKNDIVTMTDNDPRCSRPDVECLEIEYPADSITLNQLVRKPLNRIGKDKYFVYHPFSKNCQIFLGQILETFGLLGPKEKRFIYQDIGEIVKRLPFYVNWTAQKITDVSAVSKKLRGEGLNDGETIADVSLFIKDMLNDELNQK